MRLGAGIFSGTWLQDWKDGMTAQSIAVVLFMFFACVAPAIAFGSLLDYATGGAEGEYCKKKPGCTSDACPCVGDIGVIEMLLSSALCGITYAITGGSPLTILGGTGPILVFTGILYKLAWAFEIEFLPFYAWTGLWIGVFSIILASLDVAVVIKKVSRFTDEIFSGLISLIFTTSAIIDLVKVRLTTLRIGSRQLGVSVCFFAGARFCVFYSGMRTLYRPGFFLSRRWPDRPWLTSSACC